jgi:biotin carboxylase
MTRDGRPWLVLVESNTTGTGRLFASTGRALGFRPLLFTSDESRYPYVRTDRLAFRRVDTSDPLALARAGAAAEAEAPIGAVLSSSEYFVAAAAALAHRFGLPAPDPAAVLRCRDKAAQRRALADVPGAARFVECGSADQAAEAARSIGGPVVVKPCFGSGSEGVRACAGPAEARSWAKRLLAVRHNERGLAVEPRILVEELVTGPEYSVEILDGQVYGITAKHLGEPPFFVETGHDFPAPVGAHDAAALSEVARRAVAGLGLRYGPAHVELRLTARGPVVMEVNPRLAGGLIPELIRLATGHDLIASVIAAAAGASTAGGPTADACAAGAGHHAALRFLLLPADNRVPVVRPELALAVPGVVAAVGPAANPGELLARHHSFRDRIGHVLALAERPGEAGAAAEAGLRAMTARPAPAATPVPRTGPVPTPR